MQTYEDSLQFIHSIARLGSKPGLRRVTMLLERMGNPQDKLKFIHVAGSDGKGSTCTMLSSIYAQAGYRVGLYISPYVIDFRERIQVDNQMIPKQELLRSAQTVKAHWDALDAIGEPPTEFEVVVAVAMDYFFRMQCDLVILEVGMGGRFDATNIIRTPLCSVITHISVDHRQYLGDTIEEIAMEKCGIIKQGGTTVSYPRQDPAALAVIMQRCSEEGNNLQMGHRAQIRQADLFGTRFSYDMGPPLETLDLHLPLLGEHQVWNTITVLETVKVVALQGFPVTAAQIVEGIRAVRVPSRIEVLSHHPLVLLDGGHNPAEAQALVSTLELLQGKRVHAVMGMMADKDTDGILSAALAHCMDLVTVTPTEPRAMPAEELAEKARAYCPNVTASDNTARTIAELFSLCAAQGDVLLCCGSLYLASEVRPILLKLVEESILQQ